MDSVKARFACCSPTEVLPGNESHEAFDRVDHLPAQEWASTGTEK